MLSLVVVVVVNFIVATECNLNNERDAIVKCRDVNVKEVLDLFIVNVSFLYAIFTCLLINCRTSND